MPEYIEPSAETRQAASMMRAMFNAFVEQGFTEEQAMQLIGYFVKANRP